MSLTPEQHTLAVNVLRLGCDIGKVRAAAIVDALAPVINQWLFEAHIEDRFTDGDEMHALGYQRGREAGAAECRARVEAVCTFDAWLTIAPGVRVRVMHERDVRAALSTEDPS